MPALDRSKTIQAAEKHVRAGKYLEAVAEYKKLADDNPRDMNVLNKLGDLLARAGKNQEALRCFQRIADFYAKDGFFLKAIAMYKKIAKLDPSNLDSQQQLAALYQRQGLTSEAKAQYLVAAEQLIRKGQTQPASEMFQKVLEIEPDNVKVRTALAELLGRNSKGGDAVREYCQAARAAIDRGAAAEALTALRKSIHAEPGFPDLPGVLVALVSRIDAPPKDFTALAEQVSKASPASGLAAVAMAEACRRAGRRSEAEAAFKRLDVTSGLLEDLNGEAMLLVARWHTGAGRDAEGFDWLSRAVERFTSESRFPEAATALDAYLKDHPVHREALSARAALAARAEDQDAEAAALLRLAPLLIEAPDLDRAGEVVERLGKLRPGDAAVLDLRSRLRQIGSGPAAVPVATEAEEDIAIEVESAPENAAVEPEPEVPVVEMEPEVLPEDEAYGPVSKIQEIQGADGDGQPIDEEFISEHLTEADVFVKYGLLAKAREQLQSILERYPREMGAHQRLIEVHAGEGNTEAAVRECLLLADLKKEKGLDSEVRELVNEAIRIAGPGSPLVEKYAAGLEQGGGATKGSARRPEPKAGEHRAASGGASHHVAPAAAKPPSKAGTEDLEFEIELPGEPESPGPAAATIPDFAATTARSSLAGQPVTVAEETPDDRPSRRESGASGRTEEEMIAIDEPSGQDGESVLSPSVKAAPRDPDSEKLGEVDFYIEQGLTDEARQVLFQLRKQYPGSHTVAERLQRLDRPEGAAAAKPAKASTEANLDFEVEQALGGRALPPGTKQKEQKKGAPQASSRAARPRPVFKVETHQPAEEGDFFDLAGELDASLADEPERRGAQAPDSLEGPGHSFDEVLAAFRKGVEQQVDKEDYDTHYNLGIAYKEMGLVDEAIGELQFAARDPSRTLECCGILGLCFRERGMPDLALKWYRRGLDTPDLEEEKSIGLRYDMAEVYREKGEYEQALRMYMEVYGVDSNYREVSARIREVKGLLPSSARR